MTSNPLTTRGDLTVEEVWRRFGAEIRSFVRRRVSDPHRVDDLVADILLRVHRSLGTLDDHDRLAAWLFRIARNAIIDEYRRAGDNREVLEAAPGEREFLESFYLWIYTPRAHNDGTVDQFIEEVLAFPHKQAPEDAQRFLEAFFVRDDPSDRLRQISAPTLVLAGGRDLTMRPEVCRAVAELIPGARFEVMEEEAHQPFQEVPDEWNTRVDAFWREVERRN